MDKIEEVELALDRHEPVYIWHRFGDDPECNFGIASECSGKLTKFLSFDKELFAYACEYHKSLADTWVSPMFGR